MNRIFWKTRIGAFLFLASGLLGAGCSKPANPLEATGNLLPETYVAASPELLAEGKEAFERNCAVCHGLEGDGNGPAFDIIFPKPRNFVKALYRLVSTWDYVPTDEDVFKTISRGMPGSAMPPWNHLPEQTRWSLVHYVKSFSRRTLELGPDQQPTMEDAPSGKIQVPPEPAFDEEAKAIAQESFKVNCVSCHGPLGKGDGGQKQEDSEGFPTRPRDLTVGIYKGSPDSADVYKRIMAGLPGSPMPSHDHLYGDEGWHLAHFVLSLSNEEQRKSNEMLRFEISAARVERLPQDADDPAWQTAEAVDVRLMPTWWRDDRQETVAVRALHDGSEIAVQLLWKDATQDPSGSQNLADGAALQLASVPVGPPFLAMEGAAPAGAASVWMWKSAAGTEAALAGSPDEESVILPASLALKVLQQGDSSVAIKEAYAGGSYRVILRHSLESSGSDGVSLQPGSRYPVAFAIWDGSAGDEGDKKSFSFWQELVLAP